MDEQMNNAVPPAEPAAEEPVQAAPEPPSELDAAKALADENKAGWQRAIADYANLKREAEREKADLSKYAVAGFIGKLLPVVDSFRKATEQNPLTEPLDATRLKQWVDGVGFIRGQFDAVLVSAGVVAIDKDHVPFDPSLHEAMMMQPPTEGVASGTVIKVLEPGYLLHEKVIRAAKVIVTE
jgi:molecular chaperone GrpE